MNILGCTWSSISADEDKGVVTSVARIEVHPLASWMISVLFHVFSLSGGIGYFCWGRNAVKEGRWEGVDGSIAVLHVWVNDIGEYWDETEVG